MEDYWSTGTGELQSSRASNGGLLRQPCGHGGHQDQVGPESGKEENTHRSRAERYSSLSELCTTIRTNTYDTSCEGDVLGVSLALGEQYSLVVDTSKASSSVNARLDRNRLY